MAQTSAGAMKIVAAKAGIDFESFMKRVADGEKFCWRCRMFHPRSAFGKDPSRSDGLDPGCRESRSAAARARRAANRRPTPETKPRPNADRKRVIRELTISTPKVKEHPRSRLGEFLAPTRGGDRKQARSRVNHRVDVGLIPDPNDLPCHDCGHIYSPGERRHEYDHHLGYAAEHQLAVQAVCTTCHHRRDQTKTRCHRGHEYNNENTHISRNGSRTCRVCRRMRESKKRDAAWWRARKARKKAEAEAMRREAADGR